ncbi:MAG: hypothetical protein UT05_C0007G0007 [Parcubacteria group bacterium GW2011_GWF2_38_76]|nr:MAG: hypothetical protein UT05_C0007G0007 [Parcubacteria group bacterium GW2011_GWF2_38_76]HBM46117.1 hypothetical protein [Patescibacteria group bacterium]
MTKTLVENCFSLDTKRIKNDLGKFRCGRENVEGMIRDNLLEKELRVNYWFEEDSLLLSANGGEPQRVLLYNHPLTFGARTYFVCECGRNAGKLYLTSPNGHFKCRKCHGLIYEINTINKHSPQGKFFYKMNRMIKLTNKSEAMKKIFYKGRYTKAFLRNLKMLARAGFSEKVEDAKMLLKSIWA